jgi:hypothetical protein
MSDKPSPPSGFVSLKSITQGMPDADAALAEIRKIYFRTTKRTIEHDFAHAIDLLKSLATEEERERATVFMEGIAQMRKEWEAEAKRKHGASTGPRKGSDAKTRGPRRGRS